MRNAKNHNREGDTTVCWLRDRYTGWIRGYPALTRATEQIILALDHFGGRVETVDLLYFGNATKYVAAARHKQYRFDTRDANRPASDGVAERAVRRMLDSQDCIVPLWPASLLLVTSC